MNSKLSKADSAATEICCRICFASEPLEFSEKGQEDSPKNNKDKIVSDEPILK